MKSRPAKAPTAPPHAKAPTAPTAPRINPRCSICGNAYGTRFVCAPCKADEANDGWSEGSEELDPPHPHGVPRMEWGEGAPWQPTALFSKVARLLVGGATQRAAAAAAGCSASYVQKVAREIGHE